MQRVMREGLGEREGSCGGKVSMKMTGKLRALQETGTWGGKGRGEASAVMKTESRSF
jgi:hypothetical protein